MTCAFPDCDRKRYARDLCRGHYAQDRRAVPLRPITGRGFAVMDPELQRAIASLGGGRAHLKGTAHRFTQDEARRAGARGGIVSMGRRNGWSETKIQHVIKEREL